MVGYSEEILNLYGGHRLAQLTQCGAPELPDFPDYVLNALALHIQGRQYPDSAVLHLDMTFMRRSETAADEYRQGREQLSKYVDALITGNHLLKRYHSALSHFEQCINCIWQAAELFDEMEKKVLSLSRRRPALFTTGDNSDLERINKLNGVLKHFNLEQAKQTSAPLWITNTGLECKNASVSFYEIVDNISSMFGVLHTTFVEIPAQAAEYAHRETA